MFHVKQLVQDWRPSSTWPQRRRIFVPVPNYREVILDVLLTFLIVSVSFKVFVAS